MHRTGSNKPSTTPSSDFLSKTLHMTDTNEDTKSEYSETISVISFSDTDDELAEIEKKTYPEGIYGTEQAYKDIETVFDELENENILDSFTRWRPKEDPPQGKKRTKFVPKRPTALPLPHKMAVVDSHELPNNVTKELNAKFPVSAKSTGRLASAKTSSKAFPSREISSNIQLPRKNSVKDFTTSSRNPLVVELIMEATHEEELKIKANKIAEYEEQAKMQRIGSAGDTGYEDDEKSRPASSVITTFEDNDPSAKPLSAKPFVKSPSQDYIEGLPLHTHTIASPSVANFLENKQKLVKDPYTRTGQIELRRDMKALHNISPLVTCASGCMDESVRSIPQVLTGPTGTKTSTYCPNYQSQEQLRTVEPSESHVSRQEELILELAQSKDDKRNKSHDVVHLSSEQRGRTSKATKDQGDKTTFKITYKQPRWPHQVTLDKIVDRLYRVKVLILDESQLASLRDISSLLPSLIVLSVKNCGLKTMDGTLAFPNLQKLHASDNLLTHASQCSLLSDLQELDLSGNPIDNLEGFGYLGVLNFLRVIKLYDTKASELVSFHFDLRRLVPSLRDIFPKSKTLSCDFDFDDDEYLNDDYKLLGKTDEELKTEQDILKKKCHETTMITNTVASTTTDTSSNSSSRNRSIRSILKIADKTERPISDENIKTESVITPINNFSQFTGNTKPKPSVDKIKQNQLVQRKTGAGKNKVDDAVSAAAANKESHSLSVNMMNDDKDLISIVGNSSYASPITTEDYSDDFTSEEDEIDDKT